MLKAEIVSNKIQPFNSDDDHTGDGAEVVFNGRVREIEHGKGIVALDYEYYEGMAETELKILAGQTAKKFPINDIMCRHRVGEVPVGEASLHVAIWAPHRKEALEALGWFIFQLKKRIPIWKWAIYEDGTRKATSNEC